MRLLAALCLLVLIAGPTKAAGYADTGRTCDGYPRAPVEMAAGICAGLVYAPQPEAVRQSQRTLKLPRTLLQLGPHEVLVTDLGSWDAGRGSVWRLTAAPGQPPKLARLLSGLALPHTILRGPDGRIYVGEMSRIVRFDPAAPDPGATVEAVVTGLPDNRLHDNRHPLSSFLFDADGSLLVNIGAPSDQCPPPQNDSRCPEAEGERPAAAIWRYAYAGAGRWAQTPTIFARGLRNSLAMVRTPSGALLQAENSIDTATPFWPADEINLLKPGRHYGWPYCVNGREPTSAWRGRGGPACSTLTSPALLLPPHGAPLGLAVYAGAMFPQLQGRLLVTLHGYRATGSRIIAYELDAAGVPKLSGKARYAVYGSGGVVTRPFGVPAASGLVLTPGWGSRSGLRPAGAPVGLMIADDGAIWVADDRNGAILRLARDRD